MSGLVGIKVRASANNVGAATLIVGPSSGPHTALLACSSCSRFVRWLSKRYAAAVCEAITKHGGDGVTNLCKSTKTMNCWTNQKGGPIND